MVIVVVVINISISLTLFYVARRLWQFKKRLVRIANILMIAERSTHNVLYGAPEAIYLSQRNINNLREGNQSLQLQIQQIRQLAGVLAFAQRVWLRNFIRLQSKALKKK
ncbi:MAG: hypothetical protein SAK29_26710 [Scytonema sp. PMC 1069.18]|nr:hypothetical protein [Scytonema sp. PMC 1069.18]MEC4883088.1 hypothetical protein [Scytonema sp. PMC 1070.18]